MAIKSTIITEFGAYLEYGILGFSAILALLGFFIFYKCIAETNPNPIRINAAKYFLGFSLAFLIVSGVMKVMVRYFVPVEAHIRVDIAPWNDKFLSKRSIGRDFYVKTPNGKEKYIGDGMRVTVKEDSEIQCIVWPLHDRIDQLRDQLTNQVAKNPNSVISNDGGLGDDDS
tara:strand:- start:1536 stop:2048 length:513 start_codon:yes stop_codon:yes gene_type:complete